MDQKILQGKLTISRRMGSDNPRSLAISLIDALSGREVVTIEVGPAEFAEALTGLSLVECSFEIPDMARFSRRREDKMEVVFIPGPSWTGGEEQRRRVREAIAPYEVDGWVGKDDDAFNHHRITGAGNPGGYRAGISFHRWVEFWPYPHWLGPNDTPGEPSGSKSH